MSAFWLNVSGDKDYAITPDRRLDYERCYGSAAARRFRSALGSRPETSSSCTPSSPSIRWALEDLNL